MTDESHDGGAFAKRSGAGLVVALILAAASLFILAFQLSLVSTRTFDPDEFQHAHSGYLISRGQVPYRDYFEHHPPLFHFLTAPLIDARDADQTAENATRTLLDLRVFGWACGFLGALAHFLLARRVGGALVASAASLLLWSTLIVFEKTIEIRPDTQAFALLQIVLLLLCREPSRGRLAFSYFLLGVGLLFTQKLAFPILGLLGLALTENGRSKAERARRFGIALAALALPTVLMGFYFLAQGGLHAFVEDVFLINLRWKARLAVGPFLLHRFLLPNPLFAAVSVLGIAAVIFGLARRRLEQTEKVVALPALSALVGLMAVPVAWEQYYLLLLPQLAIVAAKTLVRMIARVFRRDRASFPVALAAGGVLVASLIHDAPGLYAQRLRTSPQKTAAIGAVIANSTVSDTVLDGYSGIGVFRPHAFRYFFLHAEMRLMLDASTIRELESGLETGVLAPRFASEDGNLRAVSPRVSAYLDSHFEGVGLPPLKVRVFPGGVSDWDDTSPRFASEPPPPRGAYVFWHDGWSAPVLMSGRAVRRSVGRASTLFLPVNDPTRIASIRLSVAAGIPVSGLSVAVGLNGQDLGTHALEQGVSALEIKTATQIWRRGLNRLDFSYPMRPARLVPEERAGDNATMAIESLALVALPREGASTSR